MSQHSPAPWRIRRLGDGLVREILDADGRPVLVVMIDREDIRRDAEGNARVAVAAPDALAACKALVAQVDDEDCPCGNGPSHEDDCALVMARAAIAKTEVR